jgi:hypothetical protein
MNSSNSNKQCWGSDPDLYVFGSPGSGLVKGMDPYPALDTDLDSALDTDPASETDPASDTDPALDPDPSHFS